MPKFEKIFSMRVFTKSLDPILAIDISLHSRVMLTGKYFENQLDPIASIDTSFSKKMDEKAITPINLNHMPGEIHE